MQTRLDLMPQCIDAVSRACHFGKVRGHFTAYEDGRLELRAEMSTSAVSVFAHNVSVHLFRVHAIEVDRFNKDVVSEPWQPTVTDEAGETTRLPLKITYLNCKRSRLAPVLTILFGGY